MMEAYRGIDFKTIRAWVEGDIAYMQFYRPKAMNAVNTKLLDESYELTMMYQEDPQVKAIIVCGTEHAFAAGADISEMTTYTPFQAQEFINKVSRNFIAVEEHTKPILAAVRGLALGGGFEFALACDIAIFAEDAVLGLPEIRLGIFPGGGGTQRLPRATSPNIAKQYIFTGDFMSPAEAYRLGIANKVVPAAEVLETTEKFARKMARKSPLALRAAKQAINASRDTDIKTGCRLEQISWSMLFSSEDQKEGMQAFLENRRAEFKGK